MSPAKAVLIIFGVMISLTVAILIVVIGVLPRTQPAPLDPKNPQVIQVMRCTGKCVVYV